MLMGTFTAEISNSKCEDFYMKVNKCMSNDKCVIMISTCEEMEHYAWMMSLLTTPTLWRLIIEVSR